MLLTGTILSLKYPSLPKNVLKIAAEKSVLGSNASSNGVTPLSLQISVLPLILVNVILYSTLLENYQCNDDNNAVTFDTCVMIF